MLGNIIVTGAAGILGRAVCEKVTEMGGAPLGIDLTDDASLSIGGLDLTDADAVEKAFAMLADQHGQIAGLANIAGGFVWEKVVGGSIDSFDRMYRMNLRTAALTCKAAGPHLAKGGAVVNVGAAAAAQPGEGMAAYAASKAGVAALTESLAEELRHQHIRVNVVLPSILDTPANRKDMPDANPGDWVAPQDAAETIAYLLSDKASAVTGASVRLTLGRG